MADPTTKTETDTNPAATSAPKNKPTAKVSYLDDAKKLAAIPALEIADVTEKDEKIFLLTRPAEAGEVPVERRAKLTEALKNEGWNVENVDLSLDDRWTIQVSPIV